MGRALEVISGRATNPTSLTPATPNTGDSFTVKDFPEGASAALVQAWAQEATLGVVRIRSARLHDAAQAIRLRVSASAHPLLPYGSLQPLRPNDPLTVEVQGGSAETDVVAYLVYYTDLPGIDARLVSFEDIAGRIRNIHGLEQNITTGSTAGDYGGGQSINADFDTLKADTDYALLGYLTDTAVGVVRVRGPDTGNLGVGGPGLTFPRITSEWFLRLSRELGRPCIPVINSNNRGATTFDVVHTATAATVNATLILAELG